MENRTGIRPTGKALARMQAVHLGKILFNLQFIGLAVLIASFITPVISLLFYLVLALIAMLSLFTLFANESFMALWSGGEALTSIAETLAASWAYVVPIVLALSALSIALLCLDKGKKHPARIAISGVVCAIGVVVLIYNLVTGGAA